ncbi:hypothetical protein CEP54_013282 [Fusarium duplospermum]|uniref:Uncharacterized protein n=1 Tax=Fusarium duplospermum TaxID=1325734 RepID=A0A428P3N2_9HYPO|nr:hypothetical protein CEP54_013282 [Fusarium duplospermum]
MRFSDTIHFDSTEYESKLEELVASQQMNEIREREILKNRQIYGYWTKICMGVLLCAPTAGMSAITSAVGYRQLHVACAKLDVINRIIEKYGIKPHQCGFRDRAIPIVTNVLTAGFGFGVSFMLSEVAAMGVEGASAQGVMFDPPTGVEDVASSAIASPGSFTDGFIHGFEAQVDMVSAAVDSGNTAENVAQTMVDNAVPVSVGAEFLDGGNIGFSAAAIVERFLIQQALASSLESMADADARRRLERRIAEGDHIEQIRASEEMCEWQQKLEKVYDAICVQHTELMTTHSELLDRGKNEEREIAIQSKRMREMVMSLDERSRESRLNTEECQKAGHVSAWVSCLKEWEATITKQAGAQCAWQMLIDEWKRG